MTAQNVGKMVGNTLQTVGVKINLFFTVIRGLLWVVYFIESFQHHGNMGMLFQYLGPKGLRNYEGIMMKYTRLKVLRSARCWKRRYKTTYCWNEQFRPSSWNKSFSYGTLMYYDDGAWDYMKASFFARSWYTEHYMSASWKREW